MVFLETSTPSNVSVRASSIRKVLLRIVKRVEDSDKTSKAPLTAAKGPDVKAMTATWGRYVKRNMKVVTPRPKVIVGASLVVRGFLESEVLASTLLPLQSRTGPYHKERCEKK